MVWQSVLLLQGTLPLGWDEGEEKNKEYRINNKE
jgi:hypothetical protein